MSEKEIFSYKLAKKERVLCNFCESDDLKEISQKDNYGLSVQTCICKKCGLIFINPRMTKEWYGKYYTEGEYRTKEVLKGEKNEQEQKKLLNLFNRRTAVGENMGKRFYQYLKRELVIDVGSSVGGTLNGIKKVVGVNVLGIEPSVREANYADEQGIETIVSLIEDVDKKRKITPVPTIICTQSLNHFLDPSYFLKWTYDHLEEDGILILEVKNFIHQAEKVGKLENSIQIDHIFMFTPNVFKDFVVSAGFDVLFFEKDSDRSFREIKKRIKGTPSTHMRIVARKSKRNSFEKIIITPNNYKLILRSLNKFKLRIKGYKYKILRDL